MSLGNVRRPILVGGLGLTAILWLLDRVHAWVGELAAISLLVMAGVGLWWWRSDSRSSLAVPQPIAVDRTMMEAAIAQASEVVNQLAVEMTERSPAASASSEPHPQMSSWQRRLDEVKRAGDRQTLEVVIVGGKSTGKTALLQGIQSNWLKEQPLTPSLQLQELSLFVEPDADVGDRTDDQQMLQLARQADLRLFVVTGDLTETEYQTLQQLTTDYQRTLLVFNKQDQYLPADRALIRQQLQQRVKELVPPQAVVAIATVPQAVKVRQHQADGQVAEWLEQPVADLQALTASLQEILTQEFPQLVWATTWRSALDLKTEAKTHLNQLRRARALPLIEQFQWIAAATAFANPVPALDLLATAAINTQMVMDLGAVYQLKFSANQAKAVAKTLAELLLKLGLVELTTQTIATVLKSNAITFVAGGAIQGMSAAYLTRLAGLSLLDYFQEQPMITGSDSMKPLQIKRLGQLLQSLFQQNQQPQVLSAFIQQGLRRLVPDAPLI